MTPGTPATSLVLAAEVVKAGFHIIAVPQASLPMVYHIYIPDCMSRVLAKNATYLLRLWDLGRIVFFFSLCFSSFLFVSYVCQLVSLRLTGRGVPIRSHSELSPSFLDVRLRLKDLWQVGFLIFPQLSCKQLSCWGSQFLHRSH